MESYASLHSNIHKPLWSHDAGKAWQREDYYTSKEFFLNITKLNYKTAVDKWTIQYFTPKMSY